MEVNQNIIKEMSLNNTNAKNFEVNEGDIQRMQEFTCFK
jgi:hypothetical protein